MRSRKAKGEMPIKPRMGQPGIEATHFRCGERFRIASVLRQPAAEASYTIRRSILFVSASPCDQLYAVRTWLSTNIGRSSTVAHSAHSSARTQRPMQTRIAWNAFFMVTEFFRSAYAFYCIIPAIGFFSACLACSKNFLSQTISVLISEVRDLTNFENSMFCFVLSISSRRRSDETVS